MRIFSTTTTTSDNIQEEQDQTNHLFETNFQFIDRSLDWIELIHKPLATEEIPTTDQQQVEKSEFTRSEEQPIMNETLSHHFNNNSSTNNNNTQGHRNHHSHIVHFQTKSATTTTTSNDHHHAPETATTTPFIRKPPLRPPSHPNQQQHHDVIKELQKRTNGLFDDSPVNVGNDNGNESGSSSNGDESATTTAPQPSNNGDNHSTAPSVPSASEGISEFCDKLLENKINEEENSVRNRPTRVPSMPVQHTPQKSTVQSSRTASLIQHIQSQPNLTVPPQSQPISLLSQSLLKKNTDDDYIVVEESEIIDSAYMLNKKYHSEAALTKLETKQSTQPKPTIKHNIGKNFPEGAEAWLLPGECIINHVKSIGVLKNLPVTYFPQVQSNPQAISSTNHVNNNNSNKHGVEEFLTTTEEFFNELLSGTTATNNNYASSTGSTTSNSGSGSNTNNPTMDQSDTELTLVFGELYITNFQVRFQSTSKPFLVLSTPLACILKMSVKYPQTETSTYSNYYSQYLISAPTVTTATDKFNSLGYISIKSKDFQVLKFLFFKNSSQTMEKVMETLKSACGSASRRPFAYPFRKFMTAEFGLYSQEDIENGWRVYKMKREFKRQGLKLKSSTSLWRDTSVNAKYKICDTYPEHLIVPKDVNDEMLVAASLFRSKGRIPILSWIHPIKKLCIVRSSQPMVGITRARCKEDEELVEAIRRASGSERLLIIDCRPKANAWANTVMGKGYENISYYTNCSLEFMNIENIHAMSSSLNMLKKLIQKQNNDLYWLSSFEATGWLKHSKLIMQAAAKVVASIERFDTSVLVHCSDGWDRTAQICALSELLLDPYYRTIEGFQVLIEKEWVSFGHKFLDRVGHYAPKYGNNSISDEVSPVFLQFIDCVFQVWQQYPSHFEFNENLLFLILDSLYSCKFGNFLHNSPKQQAEDNVTKETISIWTEVIANRSAYVNDVYNPKNSDFSTLIVNTDMDTLSTHFWVSYFYRYKKGPKNRYHRMLKKALTKLKKDNTYLMNSLNEEVQNRKRIERELCETKEKIRYLEGHHSLDSQGITNSYDSNHDRLDSASVSDYAEDGSKVLRFGTSVNDNLVENYFQ
nr:unnamed protein product [Naegleria fowleri]